MDAAFWSAFWNDERTQIVLLLIALDLALGVLAALKAGGFRLSFLSDFARNDIINKVLPFAVLYAGYKYAANADIVIPGVDLEMIMNAAWVIVMAALGGSLLNSLRDLGLGTSLLPDPIAGPDPATPTPPPSDVDPNANG